MNLVLLQDEIYLPSFGGGIKANRRLLESLATRGHRCVALTRALTRSPDGPRSGDEFSAELNARGVQPREVAAHVFGYEFQGVQVEALDQPTTAGRRQYLIERLRQLAGDVVLVADDKRRLLLDCAMAVDRSRVLPLIQTIIHLPFGPLAVAADRGQAERLGRARDILVISDYLRRYIRRYSRLPTTLGFLPVYGPGPFPDLGRFDRGFVTMVNPCLLKGVPIFEGLARAFPEFPFAAVPTWGADDETIAGLRSIPNVRLLPPADEIETILAQTRVLLVPSLWPETFGYVVVEAMLRGIPVLASRLGGLPEAKLGVDYLLPVAPAQRQGDGFRFPPQNLEPWHRALEELLTARDGYEKCSRESRAAALKFAATATAAPLERLLQRFAAAHPGGSMSPSAGPPR